MTRPAEEFYESAPVGYVSTRMDGTITKINRTLLDWIGRDRAEVLDRLRFADLLTVGGKLYHETHFAPLLHMQGRVDGIAMEVLAAGGDRIPVLVTAVVTKVPNGEDGASGAGGAAGESGAGASKAGGESRQIRMTLLEARDRRAYEEELLRARRAAEEEHRKAEVDRDRLQEALDVLQQSLLPPLLPEVPGLQIASSYRTASPDRMGGDFYDVFPLDAMRWGFFLGDVRGKGPKAAAITSLTRYTLRAAAVQDPEPVAALTVLNTVLDAHGTDEDLQYCTAVYGMLTPGPASFTVHLASGGHPPALVLRRDGRAGYLHTPGGQLVGALPDAFFASADTVLHPGDTLLLYTDGLTEARTGAGRELFGEEALRSFVADLAPMDAKPLITALNGLLEQFGEALQDDTALLAFSVSS
ncbi:PP2C family protein-serine/threonine phosphatase [Actinomadura madurae]|uniref:PP2C family protein-serine/threonine phosphatase n=1 Tax=Actinomadura madurae TaxID=1993 RepID=UPI000DA07797|nr:SpoIIE family protein phosphatase [Actinomadura madurae]SPT52090.1 Phosphoserine phosphatase rsbP [Actinomadura madurae]